MDAPRRRTDPRPAVVPLERIPSLDAGSFVQRLAVPVGFTACVALAFLLGAPQWWWRSVRLVLLYLVTPVGQEIWLLLGHTQFDLPFAYVAALLLCVNASVCLVFTLVVPIERIAVHLPWLGRRVARLEERVRGHPWARRGTVLALAAAVATPLHSGGAILGSMAGRLLGLGWLQTFGAVMAAITLRFTAALLIVMGLLSIPWGRF